MIRSSLRSRLLIALGLGIVLAALILQGFRKTEAAGDDAFQAVDRVIDSLLTHHGINPSGVKKWHVRTPNGATIRIERHVEVPSDLITLEFNRDLSSAVAPYGAVVSATERSRESTAVLHVVWDGMTIQTIHMETSSPRR